MKFPMCAYGAPRQKWAALLTYAPSLASEAADRAVFDAGFMLFSATFGPGCCTYWSGECSDPDEYCDYSPIRCEEECDGTWLATGAYRSRPVPAL